MEFSFPEHYKTGILSGDDLTFFYYDVGLDILQSLPQMYIWDEVVEEFKDKLDIDGCVATQIDTEFTLNRIRFTVSNNKNSDNGSKAAAFFRHLRNAFAHYRIVREGENYVITDLDGNVVTMRGFVKAELLKQFCFSLFKMRDKFINDYENTNNPMHKNQK